MVRNVPALNGNLRSQFKASHEQSVPAVVDVLIKRSDSERQVSRKAWMSWWAELPWQVKNFTHKRLRLKQVWEKLDHTGDGYMEPWEAKALLKAMNKYQVRTQRTAAAVVLLLSTAFRSLALYSYDSCRCGCNAV